ncbi:MAG TPA: ABC transporter permease [Mucilaginibacter sp.]|jgi:predicted permease|nr:ABC transporter permease [Mucilaginibacter sp.]
MIRNYIKIAFRNLKKDKQFTFLNVLGLSAGIACTLLIYLWVHDELSYDKFFDNDNRIYQVMEHRGGNGGQNLTDESSGPVSQTIALMSPEIQYASPVAPTDWFQKSTLTVGDKNIKASVQYVGKDYFNIFSFKMLHGDKSQVLAAKNSIVISDDLAQRLFGTTDAVGKTIRFQHQKDFAVTGVFEEVPVHSSQQFDFVLSFDYLADVQPWVKTWGNSGPHNFILVKPGANINALNRTIANVVTKNCSDTNRTLFVAPFAGSYLENTFNHGARVGGRAEYVKLFSLVAVFILLIACINFMNLSTAKAAGRMKEVGIKKVVGAGRSQLIIQFFSESLLLVLITTGIAIAIAWLLLPQFNLLTGKDIHLQFDLSMILMLIGIVLFTGLISGSYPALYLSKFNPLAVLKGKLNTSLSELLARKGLVVFQFTLSVMLIVAVLVVYKQIKFIQSTEVGFNKDNVIRINTEGKVSGTEEVFVSELKKIPGVINATFTQHNMIGRNFGTAALDWEGKTPKQDVYFEGFLGGYDFFQTMGMQMAQGRGFSRSYGMDTNKVVVNETAIKAMHLKDPVGKNIKMFGSSYQIIGIVKDFHFESLHEPVRPVFVLLANSGGSPFYKVMVRISGQDQKETINRIQNFYNSYNPGFPFAFDYLDAEYQKQYETETRTSTLSMYFSCLAIIISCLGLFGLVAFTAQKRQKEIGIRKVIGASVNSIIVMLTKDFLVLVTVAVLIAFPLSYYLMNQWLNGYVYRISIGPVVFLVACGAVIMITLLTVSFQAVKAALANPVRSLRSE